MSSRVINQYCVRITIRDNSGQPINQGSGTIIKKSNACFVLTARHCLKIPGDKNAPLAEKGQILIERQRKFNSPFEQIEVVDLISNNEDQDWALLKIKEPDSGLSMPDTSLGENLRDQELVFFRGYQGINNNQPRSFDAKIKETSDDEFIITLHESTFNQGGNMGADIAKGLSGSGVFLLRNDKLHLIGHLKSVVGEIALNDDIKCAAISKWKAEVPVATHNLEDIENRPWGEDNRNLNDILIRRLFEALREFYPGIANLGRKMDEKPELWKVQDNRNRVGDAVTSNYFSILGIQITKLISIGKRDKGNAQNQKEYLERINITAKRTAQLLSFICLSKLLDNNKNEVRSDLSNKGLVENFFDTVLELTLTEYADIICFLVDLYISNPGLELPFEELQELHTRVHTGTRFVQAFQKLQEISTKTDNNTYTLTDCFDAELQLAVILENLAFFSRYKMASIKRAKYQQTRNKQGNYQHFYLEVVHPNMKASKDDEKLNYLSIAPSTDAVVFYCDNYEKGINLSPFIIDLTTLETDEGCQVYFYTSRKLLNEDILTYSTTTTENNRESEVTTDLEYKNLPAEAPAVIAVLLNTNDRVQLRKDMMHRLFMETRNEILSIWK